MATRKSKSKAQEAADEILVLMKDIKRDLEVFLEGRGDGHRAFTVRKTLWEIERLAYRLDPAHKEVVEPEVMPESHQIGKKPLALTFQPRANSAKLF